MRIKRECSNCHAVLGCYQDDCKFDCNDCDQACWITDGTHFVSHGICKPCLTKKLLLIKMRRN